MQKGFSHIDLVVGITIMIFMVSLVFIYTNNQVATSNIKSIHFINDEKTDSLLKSVFDSRGSPENWYNRNDTDTVVRPAFGEFIYRSRVLVENSGAESNDTVVSVLIRPEANTVRNGTFIVYEGNTVLPTDVESADSEYPTQINLSFEIDMPANDAKMLFIYYSNDTNINYNYDTLTLSSHSLNVELLSEERKRGITWTKLNYSSNFTYNEFRDRFAIKNDFRFEVDDWSYGDSIPDDVSIFTSRKNYLYQNKSGHVKFEEVKAFLW